MNHKAPDLTKILERNFKNELNQYHKNRRIKNEIDAQEHNEYVKKWHEESGIPPKQRATEDELYCLIDMVLASGDSGTKVIKRYAETHGKDNNWRKEISKHRTGKLFKSILMKYETTNNIIIKMLENNAYSRKDILNNSVTGALKKLSEQLNYSNEKDKYKERIEILKQQLALKNELEKKDKIDWTVAQELRNQGLTVREIGNIIGASPAAVSKYTKPITGK